MTRIFFFLFLAPGLMAGCGQPDFLKEKPSSNLAVPSTLKDFRALLDYSDVMNLHPSLGALSTDLYYIEPDYYASMLEIDRNAYVWEPDLFGGLVNIADWTYPYQQIYLANLVLEGIAENFDAGSDPEAARLRGEALFFRAMAHYHLLTLFARPYDAGTATGDPGIPIRLNADVNDIQVRASVSECYGQVLEDLKAAYEVLPRDFDYQFRNRPSGLAALALEARVLLSMRDYDGALRAARQALGIYDKLIDFNQVPVQAGRYDPFTNQNEEAIFQGSFLGAATIFLPLTGTTNRVSMDTTLIASYGPDDLRRQVYFHTQGNGAVSLNGTYTPGRRPFSGLATDELYLIAAECEAFAGDFQKGMATLDSLHIRRIRTGAFHPGQAESRETALRLIREERLRELVFRERFADLRRYNMEGAGITVERRLNGETFTLSPGDARYVFPIPPDEIALSGITQNER